MYFDFYAEYETMIAEHVAEKSPGDPAQFFDNTTMSYKMKDDPLLSPSFNSRLKICTKVYADPTGATNSDGFPTMLTDLLFCPLNKKCCGVQDVDRYGELVP